MQATKTEKPPKRPQSIGEEIANAISHGLGAGLAVAGAVIIIVAACLHGTAIDIVTASLFGFSMIFLYLMSTLYHALTNKKAKYVFQVFDHCSIFILIIGTYIPICLSLLGGALGWTLFGIDLGLVTLGIVLTAVNMKKFKKLSMVLYILIGWSVIFFIKPFLEVIPLGGFLWLLGGGLCYSIGILFYKARHPKFMHSVWHVFVLGGTVLQYFFVLFYVYIR